MLYVLKYDLYIAKMNQSAHSIIKIFPWVISLDPSVHDVTSGGAENDSYPRVQRTSTTPLWLWCLINR